MSLLFVQKEQFNGIEKYSVFMAHEAEVLCHSVRSTASEEWEN